MSRPPSALHRIEETRANWVAVGMVPADRREPNRAAKTAHLKQLSSTLTLRHARTKYVGKEIRTAKLLLWLFLNLTLLIWSQLAYVTSYNKRIKNILFRVSLRNVITIDLEKSKIISKRANRGCWTRTVGFVSFVPFFRRTILSTTLAYTCLARVIVKCVKHVRIDSRTVIRTLSFRFNAGRWSRGISHVTPRYFIYRRWTALITFCLLELKTTDERNFWHIKSINRF